MAVSFCESRTTRVLHSALDHRPLDTHRVRWLVGVCFLAIITAVQSYRRRRTSQKLLLVEERSLTLAHLYRELSHIGLQELEEMVYW